MITSLKLHQTYFPKEKTQPKTPKMALAEVATVSVEAAVAPTATQVVDTCPKMTSLAH